MMTLREDDYLPMEQFALAWRFTNERWNKLPPGALARIRPLRPRKALEAHKRSLSFFSRPYVLDPGSFYTANRSEVSSDADDVRCVRAWLRGFDIRSGERVIVSWDQENAAVTDWRTFSDYWDDFCYPSSDDVVIWPPPVEWVLVHHHFGEINFERFRTWHKYAEEFEPDRSLRDICVLDTDLADWQRLLDHLRGGTYGLTFRVNHDIVPLPKDVKNVFDIRERANTSLSVDLGGVMANCHFFMEGEVEFDIDPRQVSSEARLSQVYDFMREVGDLLNKQVILTAESSRSAVIFRYLPEDGQVRHTKAS